MERAFWEVGVVEELALLVGGSHHWWAAVVGAAAEHTAVLVDLLKIAVLLVFSPCLECESVTDQGRLVCM